MMPLGTQSQFPAAEIASSLRSQGQGGKRSEHSLHPDDVEELARLWADLAEAAGLDEAVPDVEGNAGLVA